jgi:hypothetical protein
MKRPQIRNDARKVGHPNGATPAFAHLKLFRKTVPPVLLFWYQVKFMVRFGPQISGTGRKFKIISLVMVGRPARRRSESGHDGGWRLRVAAVANCEAADRLVGSASPRAAAPGSLAGLPLSNGGGSMVPGGGAGVCPDGDAGPRRCQSCTSASNWPRTPGSAPGAAGVRSGNIECE